MPFSERQWWIRGLGATGLALVGCGMLVAGVVVLISDLRGADAGLGWPLLWFAPGLGLLLAAWANFADARDARSRSARRHLARTGDVDAKRSYSARPSAWRSRRASCVQYRRPPQQLSRRVGKTLTISER